MTTKTIIHNVQSFLAKVMTAETLGLSYPWLITATIQAFLLVLPWSVAYASMFLFKTFYSSSCIRLRGSRMYLRAQDTLVMYVTQAINLACFHTLVLYSLLYSYDLKLKCLQTYRVVKNSIIYIPSFQMYNNLSNLKGFWKLLFSQYFWF